MNTLIIDDERLARNELRRMLADHDALTVVGEADGVASALDAIQAHQPDLLFLDIQMRDGSGFDLLERLDATPAVIFTTAYDQYALRAFQVNALDYLLKPIEPDLLADAIAKATTQAHPEPPPNRLTETDQVFVKDGDRCWFVRLGEVWLFESVGNYTQLHFGPQKPLIHRTLNYLEERLDPAVFFRANRQQIVNLRRIERVASRMGGLLTLHLQGGVTVDLSRRRAQQFRDQMSL